MKPYDSLIHVNGREISQVAPVYFIADIASNHDGDLERAKALILAAKDAGADAVKFQHFRAEKIVSDYGFRSLGGKLGHQSKWGKPVFDIYRQYECDRDWNLTLVDVARKAKIDFMTTPYDYEAVAMLDPYLPAYKIGSGDITWIEFVRHVAGQGKPILLASGASSMDDVERAVGAILSVNRKLVLMQCNTNYTGSIENFHYVNLRVLETYAKRWPGLILGLSDHTPGHAAVLGAVVLGARVIEKHFTDDNARLGPDHQFSMIPDTWRSMVDRCRELEAALGDGYKRVEENEWDTVVLQRRCLRLKKDKQAGETLAAEDLEYLRPAPPESIEPYRLEEVVGRTLKISKKAGDAVLGKDLEGESC
jgi:sialic acid synthase SpsE